MLHHYPPPIPQQIISIPHSLYTQPPHNHTPPSPPTVTVSYLPPATSLYATLLQSLSIKLLQSFAHAPPLHQYQLPISTFGLAHLYPPQPLFVLTQSLPHVHLRPAHIVLPASSQHALHDFYRQSELLLPCGGGRIELIESGERCCVRDLDGNLIEVQWSNHHSERSNGYFIPDAATQLSHSQRARDKSLEYSSYRERNRDRREDREVTVQSEDRRLRQRSKNRLIIPNNLTLDSGRKPNNKNRRVLQWQKDVAKSINDQDDDSYSEEYDVSNEFVSSEDDEDPLNHARSYTHSQVDYHVRSGRNKTSSPYQDFYGINDGYQTGKEFRGDYKHQKPHKHRNETTSKHRDSKYTRPLVTTASRRVDVHSESSFSSPVNQTHRSHYVSNPPSNLSTNYNSRTERVRRTEGDRAILNNGGRRDSGIGGICAYSDGEQDREEFETRSGQKYKGRRMSVASKTKKETRERYSPRNKSDPYNHNGSHGNSKGRKEKKLHRRSRHSLRHEDSYNSSGESDPESYETKSSKSEFYNKPESSRVTKDREQDKRRKWIEERDLVRDLHRKQIKRELAEKPRQKSRRDYKSHYSPARSTVPHSPSSVTRSTKREKRQILARVPKPPSAVPLQTRERSKSLENRDYDDYDDISDGSEETDSEYDLPPATKKSHRQISSYRRESQSNHDSRRQRGGSFNYKSGGKREEMSTYNRSNYDYATSIAFSDCSSFEKESKQRDDRHITGTTIRIQNEQEKKEIAKLSSEELVKKIGVKEVIGARQTMNCQVIVCFAGEGTKQLMEQRKDWTLKLEASAQMANPSYQVL
ncbi:putative blumeria specific protein, partial [Erysiphe neolycopersici]